MSEWEVAEKMPRYDDVREYEVWLDNGEVRRVRRVGNTSMSLTPGTLVFLDCTHPLSNALCDECRIVGWRQTGRLAPVLPRLTFTDWLGDLLLPQQQSHSAYANSEG